MDRAWTWQNEDDEEVPEWAWSTMEPAQQAQRGDYVHVQVGAAIASDVTSISFRMAHDTRISSLKVRLVDILGIPRSRLALFRLNYYRDELHDWSLIPENVLADDRLASPIDDHMYFSVLLTPIDQEIVIPFANDATERDIRLAISRVTGYPMSDMTLENPDGTVWSYGSDTPTSTRMILTLSTLRGGMDPRWEQRSRSRSRENPHERRTVSATDPFDNVVYYRDQSSSSSSPQPSTQYLELEAAYQRERLIRQSLREELQGQPCVQSPSPRHVPRSPDLGADLTAQHHLWSRVWPESPPPAQPPTTPRPILVDGRVVGIVHACDGASAYSVLTEVEREVIPWRPMWFIPRTAARWQDVESLHVVAAVGLNYDAAIDIRHGPWEAYQASRVIPVLTHGLITRTVIASKETSMETLQRRLVWEAGRDRHWQLMALNYDHWVIQDLGIPQYVQEQLRELQQWRDGTLHADTGVHEQDQQEDVQPGHDEPFRGGMPEGDVVTYRFLHNPSVPHQYVIPHDDTVCG